MLNYLKILIEKGRPHEFLSRQAQLLIAVTFFVLAPLESMADNELRFSKEVSAALTYAGEQCMNYGLARTSREFQAEESNLVPATETHYKKWRGQRFSEHYKNCLKEIAAQTLDIIPTLKTE
jgi:hypothetical protein